MKQNLAKFRSRLLRGEMLRLDDVHRQMAADINEHFERLYPTLFGYYLETIETLKQHSEVTSLRQQYLDATVFSMHESSPENTITVKALWNKLSRWLIS